MSASPAGTWYDCCSYRLGELIFRGCLRELGDQVMTKLDTKLWAIAANLHILPKQRFHAGSTFNPPLSSWTAAAIAMLILSAQCIPVSGQSPNTVPTSPVVACPSPESQQFLMPPELTSKNGILKGTIILLEEDQRLPLSVDGKVKCAPQLVRVFRGEGLPAPPAADPPG